MTMLLTLLAAAAIPQALPHPSGPMPAAETLALFRRLCVDTGGDPARFAGALAREPGDFRRQRILPGPDRGPSGSYLGDRAEINFVAADGLSGPLPPSLPTRSCGVLARDTAPVDHGALAAATASALRLPTGSTREARPRGDRAAMTEWAVDRSGARTRYGLVTRSSPDGRTGVALSQQIFGTVP